MEIKSDFVGLGEEDDKIKRCDAFLYEADRAFESDAFYDLFPYLRCVETGSDSKGC